MKGRSYDNLISFVICTYNQASFISECIDSILELADFSQEPIIIVNDGSTDETSDILNLYSTYPCIKIIDTPNSGIEKSCNLAVSMVNTDYYVRLDSDDILNKSFLKSLKSAIQLSSFADIIFGDYEIEDCHNSFIVPVKLNSSDALDSFSIGDFNASATAIKVSSFNAVGGFDEGIKNCGLENYSLIIRMINNGCRGFHYCDTTFRYRFHDTNISTENRAKIFDYGSNLHARFNLRSYMHGPLHPSVILKNNK